MLKFRSYDSTVGIATGYGLDSLASIRVRDSIQTGSGAHPASYSMGTGALFPGGKAMGV
jgi:hypothetical protein